MHVQSPGLSKLVLPDKKALKDSARLGPSQPEGVGDWFLYWTEDGCKLLLLRIR